MTYKVVTFETMPSIHPASFMAHHIFLIRYSHSRQLCQANTWSPTRMQYTKLFHVAKYHEQLSFGLESCPAVTEQQISEPVCQQDVQVQGLLKSAPPGAAAACNRNLEAVAKSAIMYDIDKLCSLQRYKAIRPSMHDVLAQFVQLDNYKVRVYKYIRSRAVGYKQLMHGHVLRMYLRTHMEPSSCLSAIITRMQ